MITDPDVADHRNAVHNTSFQATRSPCAAPQAAEKEAVQAADTCSSTCGESTGWCISLLIMNPPHITPSAKVRSESGEERSQRVPYAISGSPAETARCTFQ